MREEEKKRLESSAWVFAATRPLAPDLILPPPCPGLPFPQARERERMGAAEASERGRLAALEAARAAAEASAAAAAEREAERQERRAREEADAEEARRRQVGGRRVCARHSGTHIYTIHPKEMSWTDKKKGASPPAFHSGVPY